MTLNTFLLEGPKETTDFMILGYVVIFGVMLVYIYSLKRRRQNLELDLELLEEIDKEA